jgi:diaminohydroxyphosphoribosylaminopyrimidine deaminase/5-amino-6-(5-phosphoribosylamino)uracil reductase
MGELLALARTKPFGQAHAEVNALSMAGPRATGATAYVTLEPCAHTGQTGPCTTALLDAGIARVVIGAVDPAEHACGGAEELQRKGVVVDVIPHQASLDLSAPHRRRQLDGRPWVRCKWAQTLDGHVATRTGDSQWISNALSRRLVHRERGRVDAVLTGIGTVLADDCELTVRGVRARRTPMRIVIDRDLQTPLQSKLVATIDQAPLILVARPQANPKQGAALRAAGAHILESPCCAEGRYDLHAVLRSLWTTFNIGELLVEAGPRLIGALKEAHLIDELAVFVAPRILGDGAAMPAITGLSPATISDGHTLRLLGVHNRQGDMLLRYMCEHKVTGRLQADD